ncbi:MAG: hypothetical protein KDI89_03190, partial [Gammaproteobacteria bacterium]|nr:hypothetical protein [Gammaproteobacteria bacterium]
IDDDGSAADALNRFIAGHAVAAIDKRFIDAGAASRSGFSRDQRSDFWRSRSRLKPLLQGGLA